MVTARQREVGEVSWGGESTMDSKTRDGHACP